MTFSSLEEDDKSEDSGTDQTVTLKVSCASSGSPTPSLPSMTLSVAASSSYGTPQPSPLMSPQSSFHSCRSSAYLSSPTDSGFDRGGLSEIMKIRSLELMILNYYPEGNL